MKTIIYGASDDLVEIDGAIVDETDSFNSKSKITASDGTVAFIEYIDGGWKIDIKNRGKLCGMLINGLPDEDGNHTHADVVHVCRTVPIYSDALIFDSGLEWIKINGNKYKTHVVR
jgi:hypothetical protein